MAAVDTRQVIDKLAWGRGKASQVTTIRFRSALLESERLHVNKRDNLCDSAELCALHDQLSSLQIHAQLKHYCFSVVAELLISTRFGLKMSLMWTCPL